MKPCKPRIGYNNNNLLNKEMKSFLKNVYFILLLKNIFFFVFVCDILSLSYSCLYFVPVTVYTFLQRLILVMLREATFTASSRVNSPTILGIIGSPLLVPPWNQENLSFPFWWLSPLQLVLYWFLVCHHFCFEDWVLW